jgi:molybdopterin synthase catalytic subunit
MYTDRQYGSTEKRARNPILTEKNTKKTLMIDRWIEEIKLKANPEELGMILVHNGIVRATSKSGKPVLGMKLSYDKEKLDSIVLTLKQKPGVADIRVWINAGDLQVGDDIMLLVVAGRFRTDVLPVFEELLSVIKREIVTEQEI